MKGIAYEIPERPAYFDIDILGITVLSEKEAEKFKGQIKDIIEPWAYRPSLTEPANGLTRYEWTREWDATLGARSYSSNEDIGVRPVIFIKCKSDCFRFGGHTWTKLTPNMAICDGVIGYIPIITSPKSYGIEGDRFDFARRMQEFAENWLKEQLEKEH